ncbi:MAG: hypothetical protein ACRDOG_03765 [Gaiellaceae bacterium]
MSSDDISDPRAFRWVESGVSGLSRPREWDASALVEVEALAATELDELEFAVLADGAVSGEAPPEAVPALTDVLGLEPPFAVRAVRRGRLEWAVAGRALRSEPVVLSVPADAFSVEVVVAPDGNRSLLVDGEEVVTLDPAWDEAVQELEQRGRKRFQSFVARADRVGEDRWELTVDPL